MIATAWKVFSFESRALWRDRAFQSTMLAAPITLFWVLSAHTIVDWYRSGDDTESSTISGPPAMEAWILPEDQLEWRAEGRTDVIVILDDDLATVRGRDEPGRKRARAMLRRARSEERDQALRAAGLPEGDHPWVTVEAVPTAEVVPVEARLGALGVTISHISLLSLFTGVLGMSVLVEAREKGVMEALLGTRAHRYGVILGMWAVTVFWALCTVLQLWLGLGIAGALGFEVGPWAPGLSTTAVMLLSALPLAACFAAVHLLASTWIGTRRLGYIALTGLWIGSMAPAGLAGVPGIGPTWLMACLPVAGLSVGLLATMLGPPPWAYLVVSSLSTIGLAALCIRAIVGRFGTAELVYPPTTAARRASGSYAADAALLAAFVLCAHTLTSGAIGGFVTTTWPTIAQILAFSAGTAGASIWLGRPLASLVPLARPAAADIALAAAGGAAATGLSALGLALVAPHLPSPWSLVALGIAGPGVLALAATAAQEGFFRGTLWQLSAVDLGPWGRVILIAMAFAACHITPYQLLPAFLLGLLLGVAMLRSGTVWVPLTLHVAHDATVSLATRWAGLDAAAVAELSTSSTALGVAAALSVCSVACVSLIGRRRHP